MNQGEWGRDQKFVLMELERISDTLEQIRVDLAILNNENTKLKTEHKMMSAVYGFIGSLIVGAGGVIWEIMRSRH